MSLSVECRPCGKIYVIRAFGRIVTGDEATVLQAAINRGLVEFVRLVLNVSEVTRVDSTGMGLLVRFLSHTRNRGGDFRLAAAQPFFATLLQLTKLSTIFRSYDSEEAAIVSFMKDPPTGTPLTRNTGPTVLFVDQSADLCAFARTLLHNHGYDVLSTCRIHDAKTLLKASKIDYIVLGPDSCQVPGQNLLDSFRLLAPAAKTVLLEAGFKNSDPELASLELLQRMQAQ